MDDGMDGGMDDGWTVGWTVPRKTVTKGGLDGHGRWTFERPWVSFFLSLVC